MSQGRRVIGLNDDDVAACTLNMYVQLFECQTGTGTCVVKYSLSPNIGITGLLGGVSVVMLE